VTRLPIHLDYNTDSEPVGFVEIDDAVPAMDADALASCAIVPCVKLDHVHPRTGQRLEKSILSWGLIPRETVDTNPREELGERGGERDGIS
jgi:hypothetical protein